MGKRKQGRQSEIDIDKSCKASISPQTASVLSSETKQMEAGGWLHRLEKDSDTSTVVWILGD